MSLSNAYRRLERLEALLGIEHPLEGTNIDKNDEEISLKRRLESLERELAEWQSKVPSMSSCLHQVSQVEPLLRLHSSGAALEDDVSLSVQEKLDLILANEEDIMDQCALLKEISDLSKFIESPQYAVSAEQRERLLQRVEVHGKLETRSKEQTAQLDDLLDRYNLLVARLSEWFVELDARVRLLEETKKKL